MNPFVFTTDTQIVFTYDFGELILDKLSDLNIESILILTDLGIAKQDFFKTFLSNLNQIEAKITLFDTIVADAEVKIVENITRIAIDNACDLILAVGGGSVIDTAKLVNIGLTLKDTEILNYQGINSITQKLKPLWVVPTTAGTGSEVSLVAVAKDNISNKKIFFGSHCLASEYAILDPNLLVTLPKFLTAATGMDAITHAIEAYTSINSNSPITDSLCIGALSNLFAYLPIAYNEPSSLIAREHTLIASTMAGLAFSNSGVGIVHALAHAIGAKYNTHHGATNAVFLLAGIKFNSQNSQSYYDDLSCKVFNDRKANQEFLCAKISELLAMLQLPLNLKSLGLPQLASEDIEELAQTALVDPSLMFNPVEASLEDLKELIINSYN